MTTPTKNDIPSNNLLDARFNFEKLDQIVNSDASYYLDRFGKQRLTATGLQNLINQIGSDFQNSLGLPDGMRYLGRANNVNELIYIEPLASNQKIEVIEYDSGYGNKTNCRYYYDDSDRTTPSDGLFTIVTASGKRWKRINDRGFISLSDFFKPGVTSDQSAKLQIVVNYAVLNNLFLLGSPKLTIYCSSPVIISPLLQSDWNGTTIQQHADMTSGYLIGLMHSWSLSGQYVPGKPLDNLTLTGKFSTEYSIADETNNVDGLYIGGGTTQVSDLMFSRLQVQAFRRCVRFVGPSCYLLTFIDAKIMSAWSRGLSFEFTVDSGENIRFIGGKIGNCVNKSFNALGVYNEVASSGIDLTFTDVSFDYNDIDGILEHSRVHLDVCHLENNNNNPKWILRYTGSRPRTSFIVNGGSFGGGPGVSKTGIPVEVDAGRPHYIELQGFDMNVIVDKVWVGGYRTTANQTHVIKNVGGLAQRKIICNVIQDAGNTGPIPGIPVMSRNALYVPANGGYTGWTATGITPTADTTERADIDTGSRLFTLTGTQSGFSIYQTVPCPSGSSLVAKAYIKASGLTAGYATIRLQFYAGDGTTLLQDLIASRRITADTQGLVEVSIYTMAPVGSAYVRFQDYATGVTGVTGTLKYSGECLFIG